nr:RecName: Full=33.0 kDa cold shock protein; AltName: Full=AHCSP33 [Arachis hypogaea]
AQITLTNKASYTVTPPAQANAADA